MQQCKSLFSKNEDYSNFFILPCNGTQKYIWDAKEWETGSWKKVFGLNMREHLGEKYPVKEAQVKDLSGAGDTFLAGLVKKYIETKDISKSIRFANQCATVVVQKRGVSTL